MNTEVRFPHTNKKSGKETMLSDETQRQLFEAGMALKPRQLDCHSVNLPTADTSALTHRLASNPRA